MNWLRAHDSLMAGAVLALLTLAAFARLLQHDFILFDDADYVTANEHVQRGLTWSGLWWALVSTHAANWHPLTWWSHMLDVQLYGLRPWGHHLTNLLLHTTNVLLLFAALKRMTDAPGRSFVVAALFGLHPLHVESVAWVAERKDVLSTFFFLLTLLGYMAYVRSDPDIDLKQQGQTRNAPAAKTGASILKFLVCLCFFILGLMSKPMLVTVPFVLLLLDYWPLKRLDLASLHAGLSPNLRSLLVEKLPFFLLSAASCLATFLVQSHQEAVMQHLAFRFQFSNALVGYARYVKKLFWPCDLSIFYPFPNNPWPLHDVIAATLLICTFSVLAIRMRRSRPYFLVGWFWFIGTLVPVIGLVQAGGQSMADRYTYIPSIGLFLAVVWAAYDFVQESRYRVEVLALLSSGAILACFIATYNQLRYWDDGETLFRHALAVTGPNCVALDTLGEELSTHKRWGEAIPLFQQAIKLSPDYAASWRDLGVALAQTGQFGGATEILKAGVKAAPDDPLLHCELSAVLGRTELWTESVCEYESTLKRWPNFAPAQRGFALALVHVGRLDEAIAACQRAITLEPGNAADYRSLASLLTRKGRTTEAIENMRHAILLEPKNALQHFTLGQFLTQTGQHDLAVNEYEAAVRLDPGLAQAHYFLGGMFAEHGRLDDAIKQFRAALVIRPTYPEVQNDLGLALDSKGQIEEAITHLREAVRLAPENPEVHNSLGVSLAKAERLDEAVFQFQEALRLNPDHPTARHNLDAALGQKAGFRPYH